MKTHGITLLKSVRITLVCLIALPGLVTAQDFDCASIDAPPIATSVNHRDRLNALEKNDCLGGGNDLDPAVRAIINTLPSGDLPHSPGISDSERRAATLATLNRIDARISAQRETPLVQNTAGADERLRTLQTALKAARMHIAAVRDEDGLHRPGYWKYNADSGNFGSATPTGLHIDLQLFQGFLDKACHDRESNECDNTYSVSKDVLRNARLVERSLSYYASPIIDKNYRAALKRDRQWSAYFDEALFQYPWELFLNGLWMERHDKRPRDPNGNRLGFSTPPNGQWIVFHPNIGFEYLGGAADGNQFEPTVFVELLGYNSWRWGSGGELKQALGMSVIAGYSDRAGADDLAYGLMLHYRNKWSLAVTRHDKETGLLLSTDLAQFLSGAAEQARDALRFSR